MGISERFGLPGDRLGDHRMTMTQTGHGSPAASIDKPPAIGCDKLDPAPPAATGIAERVERWKT